MSVSRCVLACATVLEEILPLLPEGVGYRELDFGMHQNPQDLKQALQDAIGETSLDADTILLGYGLCSMAVVGLKANGCTLVVPKVDDCIAIFLGSRDAYKAQASKEPGTYYLTKGWIEVSDTIFDEYLTMVERYGESLAERMMKVMLKNYIRLAYIDTGHQDQSRYQDYARMVADRLQLRYEEIEGANTLVKKLLLGPWDDDFVIVESGRAIAYADFSTLTRVAGGPPGTLQT